MISKYAIHSFEGAGAVFFSFTSFQACSRSEKVGWQVAVELFQERCAYFLSTHFSG